MPFYLRKSWKAGPLRLNLSKSGLGASVGVPGLRLGTGPRGGYVHAGRGGLYYRQRLSRKRPTAHATFAPSGATLEVADTAVAQEYADLRVAGDVMATEISQRLGSPRYAQLLWVAALVALAVFGFAGRYYLAILVAIALAGFALYRGQNESARRRILIEYNLQEEIPKALSAAVERLLEANRCAAIWRVTSASTVDAKYSGGATTSVERTPIRLGFNDAPIAANTTIATCRVAGGQLCLLPERMLFFVGPTVVALDYESLQLRAQHTAFREDGVVPADAEIIGYTWQFVNKSGAPDKRFANNRQIPIINYSDLFFEHPLLSFRLQFSRADQAASVGAALALMREVNAPGVLAP